MKRLSAIVLALLSISILVPIILITQTYIIRPNQVDSLGDWISVLLPLAPPIISLGICALMWFRPRSIINGINWGVFTAATLYLLQQSFYLFRNYSLIKADGTAHWALLQMPVVWIGIPALMLGIGVGAIVGWIAKKWKAQQGVAGYRRQSAPQPER